MLVVDPIKVLLCFFSFLLPVYGYYFHVSICSAAFHFRPLRTVVLNEMRDSNSLFKFGLEQSLSIVSLCMLRRTVVIIIMLLMLNYINFIWLPG